jgi:predicted amidohydrolase YtcJ
MERSSAAARTCECRSRSPFPPPTSDLRSRGAATDSRDLLLVNGRVITLDPPHPIASAVVLRGGRVLAVGRHEDLRVVAGTRTETLDCEGGLVIPAFHDAHLHLLSWARFRLAIDCRHTNSIAYLQASLRESAATLAPGEWVRGNGYDETLLGRHPERDDLDAAVSDHPVRLQHRTLHLDVLNTAALAATGLAASGDRRVERDPVTGEPTGRLFSAGDLLREATTRPPYARLAADVRRASDQLLAWGVTSIQDATYTNGAEEWDLLHRLAANESLRVRAFMMVGSPQWREVCRWRPSSDLVRHGPVKLMLDEATTDQDDFRRELHAIRAADQPVAVHAVSEAEVALASDGLRSTLSGRLGSPNRLEHAAVVPDELLHDLSAVGATVVGQPALVFDRGDVYRSEYPSEQHAWLHRARSFIAAGIPYAAGSDAPVTEPNPAIGLFAALHRTTKSGVALGPAEALPFIDALGAFTLTPAQSVGAGHSLGRIRPGMIADIAVLDPKAPYRHPGERPLVRMTIMGGKVVAGG